MLSKITIKYGAYVFMDNSDNERWPHVCFISVILEERKEMFCSMKHSTHFILWLYSVLGTTHYNLCNTSCRALGEMGNSSMAKTKVE